MIPTVAERKLSRTKDGRSNVFGVRIREIREHLGLKQADVIRELQIGGWEIPHDVYSQVESGNRSITDIELVALLAALGKTTKDL